MTVQLTSCANDTKWRELQGRMAAQGTNAPSWRTKSLPPLEPGAWRLARRDDEPSVRAWDGEWFYHFRSDTDYARIEWCELRPKSHRGAMTRDAIVAVCAAIGFELELHGDTVRVLGYRRPDGSGG